MKAVTLSGSRFQTATEKPWSSTFLARFSPITARPIIPNCALSIRPYLMAQASIDWGMRRECCASPLTPCCFASGLDECSLHGLGQRIEPTIDVAAEGDAHSAPIAARQRLVIADGLGSHEHTEGERLTRQRDVARRPPGQLHEYAGVHSAFWE